MKMRGWGHREKGTTVYFWGEREVIKKKEPSKFEDSKDVEVEFEAGSNRGACRYYAGNRI